MKSPPVRPLHGGVSALAPDGPSAPGPWAVPLPAGQALPCGTRRHTLGCCLGIAAARPGAEPQKQNRGGEQETHKSQGSILSFRSCGTRRRRLTHLTGMEVYGKGHVLCRALNHGRTRKVGRVGSSGLCSSSYRGRGSWPLAEVPTLAGTPRAGRGTLIIPTLLLPSKPLSGGLRSDRRSPEVQPRGPEMGPQAWHQLLRLPGRPARGLIVGR